MKTRGTSKDQKQEEQYIQKGEKFYDKITHQEEEEKQKQTKQQKIAKGKRKLR